MSESTFPVVATAKWLDLSPHVDRLEATVATDARRGGFSEADQAALEVALELADNLGVGVRLITAGPIEAERDLAELGAAGADDIVRVDLEAGADSATVAAAIAPLCEGAPVVVCGDMSRDRGSGAVPATLAHRLGAAQALGLLSVSPPAASGESLRVLRRLDGGRREVLDVPTPAVLSVEGAVATLRRAGLDSLRRARGEVRVVSPHVLDVGAEAIVTELEPWRPPPRLIAPPEGEAARTRIIELTGALVDRTPPRRVDAGPREAAEVIADQLRTWGYLP